MPLHRSIIWNPRLRYFSLQAAPDLYPGINVSRQIQDTLSVNVEMGNSDAA